MPAGSAPVLLIAATGVPVVVTVNVPNVPTVKVAALALVIVGAELKPGVTLFDGAEGALVPIALDAVTVNVYATPLDNEVTVWVKVVLPAFASTPPAGFDVTVYPVIALPPSLAGALKVTLAELLPGDATTLLGGSGTPLLLNAARDNRGTKPLTTNTPPTITRVASGSRSYTESLVSGNHGFTTPDVASTAAAVPV